MVMILGDEEKKYFALLFCREKKKIKTIVFIYIGVVVEKFSVKNIQ